MSTHIVLIALLLYPLHAFSRNVVLLGPFDLAASTLEILFSSFFKNHTLTPNAQPLPSLIIFITITRLEQKVHAASFVKFNEQFSQNTTPDFDSSEVNKRSSFFLCAQCGEWRVYY
jgi:hypothetical protein